jgi:hypothetical protein
MTEQHETIPIQDYYSSDELAMGDHPRITLGDYGRMDNFEEVSLRFQPTSWNITTLT